MDKAKEDPILEVELSLVHHRRPTHLDPSQVPHLHPLGLIQEQHLGSSHLNQMCHIPLGPTQGPQLDSNQIHLILQHPIQGLQLGQTQKHLILEPHLAHSNQEPHLVTIQEPHLAPIQEPLLANSNQEHLGNIQEPLLAHSNQEHLGNIQEPLLAHSNQEHLGNIQEPLLAHSNQEHLGNIQEHLGNIQEPLLAHSNQEHLGNIQELLLARSNQEPLGNIQELLLAHSNQEPLGNIQELLLAHSNQEHLGNIQAHLLAHSNQEHLGNTPTLQGQWDPVGCQVHILTLLVNHIHLHLTLMVSLVIQVLHLVGQGGLGDPRVGNTPRSLIYHTQVLLHFQSLALVLHRLYPGVQCHLVSGGHQHHFLELLDHTQTEDIPEVAESLGPVLRALAPSLSHPNEERLLEAINVY